MMLVAKRKNFEMAVLLRFSIDMMNFGGVHKTFVTANYAANICYCAHMPFLVSSGRSTFQG
jgi:hypothetical protein